MVTYYQETWRKKYNFWTNKVDLHRNDRAVTLKQLIEKRNMSSRETHILLFIDKRKAYEHELTRAKSTKRLCKRGQEAAYGKKAVKENADFSKESLRQKEDKSLVKLAAVYGTKV